jgi:hypothetical protein
MRKRNFALALLAAGLLTSWGTANAVTLRLDAVSATTGLAAFDVVFEDTGDGLLQFEEILSTSGILLGTDLYPALLGVPTIEGISTLGGPCGPSPDEWCFVSFDIGLAVTITTDEFAYSISPAAVSEPASLSLLGIALGILAARRRHARRTA